MTECADIVANALEAALEVAVSNTGPGIVTKFICVAEVIDEYGERRFWRLGTDNLSRWDVLGMLKYAEEQT